MLRRLTIQNYALIESLDIDFPNGLAIITGETGAGKSILLGALSLLLGAKADVEVLKDSSVNCIVEGDFEIKNLSVDIKEQLIDAGVELTGGELLLRRVIYSGGRSRAFINDAPVPLSLLVNISGRLIDIHAQHQHLLLTDGDYQLSVLDYFAGAKEVLERYRSAHTELLGVKNELAKLNAEIESNNKELDYKQYQFDKLEEAKLVVGELEELEAEQKQLANAEEIKTLTHNAIELMQPMGVSIVQNLKEVSLLLKKCSNFVPEFASLTERVDSCRIECKDIEAELANAAEKITVSPQRLEIVEERISIIDSFFKKYGVNTVQSLIEVKNTLEQELLNAGNDLDKKEELSKEVEALDKKRELLAKELSKIRNDHKEELSRVLEEKIKELEMPLARFNIELTKQSSYSATGCDTVGYMFSANGSEKLIPLHKAASGGELSRIMLCIKSLMAKYTGMPTMIFDEIDTGVSGSIADKMGNLIGELGENMQIFAITHLPQIAAKGDTHLLVYKEINSDKVVSTKIKQLNSNDRIMEIARMLSGAELSKAAIENAKFLLKK